MTLEQGGGADRYSIAEVLQVHRDGQRTVHPASSGRNAVCVRECARVDHCGNLVFFSRIYLPTGDLTYCSYGNGPIADDLPMHNGDFL